jgi:hypothetical protein
VENEPITMRCWACFFITWAVLAVAWPVSQGGSAGSEERAPPAVDRKPGSGLPEIIAGFGALSLVNLIAKAKLPLPNRRSAASETKTGRSSNGQVRPIHDPLVESQSDGNNDLKMLAALQEEAQRCTDLVSCCGTTYSMRFISARTQEPG